MSIKKSLIPLLLSLGIAIIGLSVPELRTDWDRRTASRKWRQSNEDGPLKPQLFLRKTLVNDSEEGESETSEGEEIDSNNLDNNVKQIDNEIQKDSESDDIRKHLKNQQKWAKAQASQVVNLKYIS